MYNPKNGDNILIIANDEPSIFNIKNKIAENVKITSIPISKIESTGEKFNKSCLSLIRNIIYTYIFISK